MQFRAGLVTLYHPTYTVSSQGGHKPAFSAPYASVRALVRKKHADAPLERYGFTEDAYALYAPRGTALAKGDMAQDENGNSYIVRDVTAYPSHTRAEMDAYAGA